MISQTGQFSIPVTLSGSLAAAVMACPARGRVAAVFRSSFYIEMGAGFACVGNETLEPSPLTFVTAAKSGADWSASGLRKSDTVSVSPGRFVVANRFCFGLSAARKWVPPARPEFDAATLARGLAAFRPACADALPGEGLGRFIVPGFEPADSNYVSLAARRPIKRMRRWLRAALGGDRPLKVEGPEGLRALVGLGPGLTPSGDDYIGGVLIALHAFGESGIARQLWEAARTHIAEAGNPISAACLAAAAGGQGGASLHNALEALLTGNSLAVHEAIGRIRLIGHTSGWDAMAGVTMACEEWLAAFSRGAGGFMPAIAASRPGEKPCRETVTKKSRTGSQETASIAS